MLAGGSGQGGFRGPVTYWIVATGTSVPSGAEPAATRRADNLTGTSRGPDPRAAAPPHPDRPPGPELLPHPDGPPGPELLPDATGPGPKAGSGASDQAREGRRDYLLGWGVTRRYGLMAVKPLGKRSLASSSDTAGTTMTSSPSVQLTGVATL